MNIFNVVNKNDQPIFTDETLYPGEVLAMEIESRGLKKRGPKLQLRVDFEQIPFKKA